MTTPRSSSGGDSFKRFAIVAFVLAVVAIFFVVPILSKVGGGGDGDVVRVTMWTSGEKLNYLKDLVTQFNDEKHTLPGGKRIEVTAYTVNSGPQSDYLIAKLKDGVDFPNGITPPQIASPSVDHWLTRVNYVTGKDVFDIANEKPLALTPVVIATFEEMARALGWPQKELGWADIIDLANNPDGWASYPGAKVEWGKKPLLGWTDPTISSTARTALFATYVAATGKQADQLTVSDVNDPKVQQYVRSLQGAVDHYFPETLKLQTKIFLGPKFIHLVPLEEYNLVWLKEGKVNSESVPGAKPELKPLDRKMVAIYPKEGTIWHNNPGGILHNVPWSSPDQEAAAAVWVDYLLEPAQQQVAMDWGFRPANPNVKLGPKFSADYGIDPAQPKKLLGEVKPAVAEEIMSNWTDVKKPGVAVLVLDTSGSMQGEKMDQAKEGALKFIDSITENNYLGIVTFSSGVNRTVPVGPIAKTKFDVADAVERSTANGNTALYDAIKVAVQMADSFPVQGDAIRGVVVLSDGENNAGNVKLSDLFQLRTTAEAPVLNFNGKVTADIHGSDLAVTTTNKVHIFSIGYGKDADLDVLRVFSEATNSTFNTADPKNITQVLETFGKYF